MKRQIRAEFWKGKQFTVDINSANKTKRGFTFSNRSPHNHGDAPCEMGIKPYCKGCGELTCDEPTHKLFKLGKEYVSIPAEAIDAIKQREENSDIVLTVAPMPIEKVYSVWSDFDDWFDDQKYIEQVEKKEGDYALLKEALRGKMAFGKAKFGFAEYAVAVYVAHNNKLRMRVLVDPSQRRKEADEKEVAVSSAMVDVLRQISEKSQTPLPAIEEFAEDGNRKQMEDLIAKASNGDVVVAEVIKETTEKKEADELAELQKLLE